MLVAGGSDEVRARHKVGFETEALKLASRHGDRRAGRLIGRPLIVLLLGGEAIDCPPTAYRQLRHRQQRPQRLLGAAQPRADRELTRQPLLAQRVEFRRQGEHVAGMHVERRLGKLHAPVHLERRVIGKNNRQRRQCGDEHVTSGDGHRMSIDRTAEQFGPLLDAGAAVVEQRRALSGEV